MSHLEAVNPPEWPRPRGYANGVVARGRTLYIAGQIGWLPDGTFPSEDLAEQFALALDNVLAVVHAAGGKAHDIAKMTVYVTDLDAYRSSLPEIGAAWKARFERHYPAMALLGVAGLVERKARVEIEALAVLDEAGDA